jgi:hypothetical protein
MEPMRRYFLVVLLCCLVLLSLTGMAMRPLDSTPTPSQGTQQQNSIFPTVDPNYIYDQLYTMANRFQHRESGYDGANSSHKAFADYWSQEMLKQLSGFAPVATTFPFNPRGWLNRVTTSPGYNVEVSIPGAVHPEQIVIIGCHYDGEAVSTQSAYDDTSGCAIELGVAKAMANYWRQHQLYPARTMRFVIFDAEEQGLDGSFAYVNHVVNGDLSNIVAMFNEEQNGIAYPLRYLGQQKNALMPFEIWTSPLENQDPYSDRAPLNQQQKERITRLRELLQQALPLVFQTFRQMGYAGLTYHNDQQQDVAQQIFTPDHLQYVKLIDDTIGSSDQMPFTFAGLPCATFAGNSTYYEKNAPPGSYPYDQRDDTIQLMNTFAHGSSQKSQALALALALPAMLTTWMLHQPDIAGSLPANELGTGKLLATIGDLGKLENEKPIVFTAQGALDPQNSNATFNYSWDFGDGNKANGATVGHTYENEGDYTVMLTVASGSGQTTIRKQISVVFIAPSYPNPYGRIATGSPTPNPGVKLPKANDLLTDRVYNLAEMSANPSPIKQKQASTPQVSSSSGLPWLIGFAILAVILLISSGVLLRRRAHAQQKPPANV